METVKIIDTYDRKGYLIRRTANGIEIPIPNYDFPSVVIMGDYKDADWLKEEILMTKEEFNQRFNLPVTTNNKE